MPFIFGIDANATIPRGNYEGVGDAHVGATYALSGFFGQQIDEFGMWAPNSFDEYCDAGPQATFLKAPPNDCANYEHPRIDYFLIRGEIEVRKQSCGTVHIENFVKGVDHMAVNIDARITPAIGHVAKRRRRRKYDANKLHDPDAQESFRSMLAQMPSVSRSVEPSSARQL